MQFLFTHPGGISILVLLLIGLGALIFFTQYGRAISIVMLVIFAGLGTYISAQTLSIRNGWARQAEELAEANETNEAELIKSRKELQSLKDEYDRIRYGWSRVWSNVNAQGINTAQGPMLQASFGSNQGLGRPNRPEAPTLHAFREDPAGGWVYVGLFQVADLLENDVRLRPMRLVRGGNEQLNIPSETVLWGQGNYRFREMVPDSYTTRFGALRSQLTAADERLVAKQQFLASQTKLVETAQRDLDNRLLELGYDRQNQRQIGGLLEAIETEEQERNAVIYDIDQLRRQREKALQEFSRLNAENRKLVAERADLAERYSEDKPAVTAQLENN